MKTKTKQYEPKQQEKKNWNDPAKKMTDATQSNWKWATNYAVLHAFQEVHFNAQLSANDSSKLAEREIDIAGH